MTDVVHETQEITGTFKDFFPPEDPHSPWLFRLMIIREDVHFARQQLRLKEEDGTDEIWRLTYFLRTLSVSLMEARNIFAYELTRFAKSPQDEALKTMAPLLQSGIAKLKAVEAPLECLRDAIGGHVRPQNVDKKGPDVVNRVIANHPLLGGTVKMAGPTEEVSYKALASNAILFAWPEVASNEEAVAKQKELSEALKAGAQAVVLTVDGVLGYHWFKHGILKPPEGMDFAVRDKHDQNLYRPIKRPAAQKRA